jgi:hypothetical protein
MSGWALLTNIHSFVICGLAFRSCSLMPVTQASHLWRGICDPYSLAFLPWPLWCDLCSGLPSVALMARSRRYFFWTCRHWAYLFILKNNLMAESFLCSKIFYISNLWQANTILVVTHRIIIYRSKS